MAPIDTAKRLFTSKISSVTARLFYDGCSVLYGLLTDSALFSEKSAVFDVMSMCQPQVCRIGGLLARLAACDGISIKY